MISQFTPLSKICSNISRKFSPPKNNKVWFINTGDVLNGKFLHNDISDWSNLPGQAKKAIEENDILYSEIRPGNGRFAFVCREHTNAVVSTKFMVIKSSKDVYPRYLYHYLTSPRLQRDLKSIADSRSGTFPQITFDSISHLEIRLPEIKEQKSISNFLDYLQNKLETNEKTNETLEKIANTLFKSWFIDFDPVRAKSEGRSTGLPDEISDLFPDSFEDSELGEIPHEWAICNIDDLLDLEKNSINPIESPEEIFDHYSIPAFDDGHNPTQDNGFSIKSSKFLIPENTFLVCKLNPRFPRVWLPSKESSRRRISSTEFLVCKYKKNVGLPYAYYLTKSFRVTQAMRNMATGTSSSHQRLRPKDFTSILTVRPNPQLLDCFTDILFPFLEKSLMIRDQNILLKRYRDTVLPKLISGDLRIPDAEKIIEEVGI